MSDVPRLVAALTALAAQEDNEGMLAVIRSLSLGDCRAVAYFLACDLARARLGPYRDPAGEIPPEARAHLAESLQQTCALLAELAAADDKAAAALDILRQLAGDQ